MKPCRGVAKKCQNDELINQKPKFLNLKINAQLIDNSFEARGGAMGDFHPQGHQL
jgi:hypothetical protein